MGGERAEDLGMYLKHQTEPGEWELHTNHLYFVGKEETWLKDNSELNKNWKMEVGGFV